MSLLLTLPPNGRSMPLIDVLPTWQPSFMASCLPGYFATWRYLVTQLPCYLAIWLHGYLATRLRSYVDYLLFTMFLDYITSYAMTWLLGYLTIGLLENQAKSLNGYLVTQLSCYLATRIPGHLSSCLILHCYGTIRLPGYKATQLQGTFLRGYQASCLLITRSWEYLTLVSWLPHNLATVSGPLIWPPGNLPAWLPSYLVISLPGYLFVPGNLQYLATWLPGYSATWLPGYLTTRKSGCCQIDCTLSLFVMLDSVSILF